MFFLSLSLFLNGKVFVIAILLPLSVLMSLQSSLVSSLWKGQAIPYGPFHCSTRGVFTIANFGCPFFFHSLFSSFTNVTNKSEAGPDWQEKQLQHRRQPKCRWRAMTGWQTRHGAETQVCHREPSGGGSGDHQPHLREPPPLRPPTIPSTPRAIFMPRPQVSISSSGSYLCSLFSRFASVVSPPSPFSALSLLHHLSPSSSPSTISLRPMSLF